MPEPTDCELSLRRKDAYYYGVDLLVNQPESEAPVSPLGQQPVTVYFDHDALLAAWSAEETAGYGRALGEMLFAEPALLAAFAAARAEAAAKERPLRLRLAIGADAPELHALRWETLIVPGDTLPLALSERVLLARTLGSADWQPVTLRAKDALQALLVIAAPDDLANYGLAPIDAAAEQERAMATLGNIRTTVLAEPGLASLNTILARLREGYDLLYLVVHGDQQAGESWLFLDDGQGQTEQLAASMFLARLADLPLRPRLALLASCESAGENSLATLGPGMATAGIPAVIAMQGQFSQQTNAAFVPTFLKELQDDGRIDRALALARQQVATQPDWWMPALFTRLRSGRIWYEPGFDEQDFAKWPTLARSITRGKCTPILGPGLLDSLTGSSHELARRLATRHRFPLALNDRDDLPQVAQYLAVHQDIDFMRDELAEVMRESLAAHSNAESLPDGDISDVLAAAGARRRAEHPDDPHRLLAGLQLPIFLTANAGSLLEDALLEAGKQPQARICPWNRHGELGELDQDPLEPPNKDQPLVYHLFGRLDDPETLVLTEDDYFRYLIGVTRNEDLFPKVVGSALVNSALLFLGFRLEDWNFRVLFQSVMNLAGAGLRGRHTHVAVQIDPQEDEVLDPDAAREYLKTYFGPTTAMQYQTNISIYWGSAEDFLRELAQRVK